MTRSFCCHFVLLLLPAACARRERPFVPGAAPADAAASRLVVTPEGKIQGEMGSIRVLLDAPGRLRRLSDVFRVARDAGIVEIDALVDTETGRGAVPLRLEARGRFGYYEKLELRDLWLGGERAAAALARPGIDGHWELLKKGTVASLRLLGEPLNPQPDPPPAPLESVDFILLLAGPEDDYQDVVLSLVALERRFPGKVILRPPR